MIGEGAADGIALDGGDDDPHVLRIFAGSARSKLPGSKLPGKLN